MVSPAELRRRRNSFLFSARFRFFVGIVAAINVAEEADDAPCFIFVAALRFPAGGCILFRAFGAAEDAVEQAAAFGQAAIPSTDFERRCLARDLRWLGVNFVCPLSDDGRPHVLQSKSIS